LPLYQYQPSIGELKKKELQKRLKKPKPEQEWKERGRMEEGKQGHEVKKKNPFESKTSRQRKSR